MTATRAQAAIIETAYRTLPECFRGFGEDKHRLYEKCLASEREHRSGRPAPRGFSANLAARYFAVKWLREYSLGVDKLPTIADYLHLREECYFAAAMSVEHAGVLQPWAASVPAEFDALDYAKLMED